MINNEYKRHILSKIPNLRFFTKEGLPIPISIHSLVTFEIESPIENCTGIVNVSSDGGIDFIIQNSGKGFDKNIQPSHIIINHINGTKHRIKFSSVIPTYESIKGYTSSDSTKYVETFGISKLEVRSKSISKKYIQSNLPFPSIFIDGKINLETVSTDFISQEHILIMEEVTDKNGTKRLIRPFSDIKDIDTSDKGFITIPKIALSSNDESTFLIDVNLSNSTLVEMNYQEEYSEYNHKQLKKGLMTSKYYSEDAKKKSSVPFEYIVGFRNSEEGSYNPSLQFLLIFEQVPRNVSSNVELSVEEYEKLIEPYDMGSISLDIDVVGIDERYKTFFENFGIPNPSDYVEVFKEVHPNEQYKDAILVNAKSKELFLSYDEIFPFAGTYKALINAVNFLGYDDIYFKEWYKKIDEHNNSKLLNYVSVDVKNKLTLSDKLRSAGIQYDDFLSYKKLNKLSMVYKLNEVIEDSEDEYGIPITRPVYDYTNKELLIKLYSLRRWLEEHIIGVNTQISDITAEGIYFQGFKNRTYAVGSYNIEGHFSKHLTPKFYKNINNLKLDEDLESEVGVTLSEFTDYDEEDYPNNGLCFEDLGDYRISDFVKNVINLYEVNGIVKYEDISKEHWNIKDDAHIPISSPISALSLLDEVTYTLKLDNPILTKYGSEHIVGTAITKSIKEDNGIFIYDNNISILDKKHSKVSFEHIPEIHINFGKLYELDEHSIPSQEPYVTIERIVKDNKLKLKVQYKNENGINDFISYHDNYFTFDYTRVSEVAFEYVEDLEREVFTITTSQFSSRSKKFIMDLEDATISNEIELDNGSRLFEGIEIIDNSKTRNGELLITPIIKYTKYREPIFTFDYNLFNTNVLSQYHSVEEISNTWNRFIQEIDNNAIFLNSKIDFYINHIGEYIVEVFGYDGYNHTYHNTSKQRLSVYKERPSILCGGHKVLSGLNTSNNRIKLDRSVSEYPIFKNVPRVYNLESDYSYSDDKLYHILYDGLEYSDVSPKENDFVTINNLSTYLKLININESDDKLYFYMPSGVRNKQFINQIGNDLSLIVFNTLSETEVEELDCLEVTNVSKYNEDGVLVCKIKNGVPKETRDRIYSYKNEKYIKFYLNNVTEYEIKDYINIPNSKVCALLVEKHTPILNRPRNTLFEKGQTIKVIYKRPIILDETIEDFDKPKNVMYYTSQTSYKVIEIDREVSKDIDIDNIYKQFNVLPNSSVVEVVFIDGLIDNGRAFKNFTSRINYDNFVKYFPTFTNLEQVELFNDYIIGRKSSEEIERYIKTNGLSDSQKVIYRESNGNLIEEVLYKSKSINEHKDRLYKSKDYFNMFIGEYKKDLYVSYANQRLVHYSSKLRRNSIESRNGTAVFLKKPLDFYKTIDNTYSLTSRPFSIASLLSIWNTEGYEEDVKGFDFINDDLKVGKGVKIVLTTDKPAIRHRWRISDEYENILGEVENDTLFLKFPLQGKYIITYSNTDKYGNSVESIVKRIVEVV